MNQSDKYSTFDEQLERIQIAAGVKSQKALAEFLGVELSALNKAREVGKIPGDWLVILFRCQSVNPEWILTGTGMRTIETPHSNYDDAYLAYERVQARESLKRLSSKALADELIRRLVVAEADKFLR